MISTIHLEYTADMKHMKVTGIDSVSRIRGGDPKKLFVHVAYFMCFPHTRG